MLRFKTYEEREEYIRTLNSVFGRSWCCICSEFCRFSQICNQSLADCVVCHSVIDSDDEFDDQSSLAYDPSVDVL